MHVFVKGERNLLRYVKWLVSCVCVCVCACWLVFWAK